LCRDFRKQRIHEQLERLFETIEPCCLSDGFLKTLSQRLYTKGVEKRSKDFADCPVKDPFDRILPVISIRSSMIDKLLSYKKLHDWPQSVLNLVACSPYCSNGIGNRLEGIHHLFHLRRHLLPLDQYPCEKDSPTYRIKSILLKCGPRTVHCICGRSKARLYVSGGQRSQLENSVLFKK
jgi:hypothetical protein